MATNVRVSTGHFCTNLIFNNNNNNNNYTDRSAFSERNLLATEVRASTGHSWNQSMLVQLTTAGKR